MVPILLVVVGYLVWSTYLYSFGFVQNDFLRSKYIMAGFAFVFLSLILLSILMQILGLLYFLYSKIVPSKLDDLSKRAFKATETIRHLIILCAVPIWFLFYTQNIFPLLPNVLGGGQPRALSLLAIESSMPLLNSLSIQIGEGAIYQTANLCVLDQDNQGIYILLADRALMLNNTLFQGFGSLPGFSAIQEQDCIKLAQTAAKQAFVLKGLLFGTSAYNLFADYSGISEKHFVAGTKCSQ